MGIHKFAQIQRKLNENITFFNYLRAAKNKTSEINKRKGNAKANT